MLTFSLFPALFGRLFNVFYEPKVVIVLFEGLVRVLVVVRPYLGRTLARIGAASGPLLQALWA